MPSPGRPRVLDETRCNEICDLVAAGHSVATAARLVGCDVRTIRRHACRDESFGRRLRTAEVSARNDPLKMMRRAAHGSWRAAAWLLERTDPERYGKLPPANCRPEDVDRTFTRIMETVLSQIDGESPRRAMYLSLAKVMEEESVRLFLPRGVRRPDQNSDFAMHVDQQRLSDLLDSLSTPRKAASAASGASPTTGIGRAPASHDAKNQAPNNAAKADQNKSARL
jgi:hypothetical protein